MINTYTISFVCNNVNNIEIGNGWEGSSVGRIDSRSGEKIGIENGVQGGGGGGVKAVTLGYM